MKHYKIEKKIFYAINKHGEIIEQSTYKCYVKVWFWWESLKSYEMYDSGFVSDSSLGFDNIKNAENFIYKYHENRNKVGKCEISIVEKIDLDE